MLLASSSSMVLLNGIVGESIQHGRGLRQGNPLSPLLFILAIDPLQRLLNNATDSRLLSKLKGRYTRLRTSMYADDAVVFLNPKKEDVSNFAQILQKFAESSGLSTNVQKSSVILIRCEQINLEDVLEGLPATRTSFPIKYLGLPLSVTRLRRVDYQPLADKATGSLASWKGKNIALAGQATLVKIVLSSQPVYLLTALKIPKKVLEDLDRKRKKFLWAGNENLTGGKCKVNWARACMPLENGGLGILNMEKFARALRTRWLWHEWNSEDKAWIGLGNPCDETDRLFFAVATSITLGDGMKADFWNSGWMGGCRRKDIVPAIFAISRKKSRKVREALQDDNWVSNLDMHSIITIQHIQQLVHLWNLVQDIHLDPAQRDSITWKLSTDGQYKASSAYKV